MVAPLISVSELDAWCPEVTIELDDVFANKVVDAASVVVRDTALHPEWTAGGPTAAPPRAKIITATLAKRSYLNPSSEISSAVGPLSSSTVAELARFLHLTQAEIDALTEMRPGAIPGGGAGLWVQPTNQTAVDDTIYLGDISGSDWYFPFLDPDKDPYYVPLLGES